MAIYALPRVQERKFRSYPNAVVGVLSAAVSHAPISLRGMSAPVVWIRVAQEQAARQRKKKTHPRPVHQATRAGPSQTTGAGAGTIVVEVKSWKLEIRSWRFFSQRRLLKTEN
jgi:hypothetical protein